MSSLLPTPKIKFILQFVCFCHCSKKKKKRKFVLLLAMVTMVLDIKEFSDIVAHAM